MGTENSGRPNFPVRPAATPFAAAAPPTAMPFSSSGPVPGSVPSGFRPTPQAPAAPQTSPTPFSSYGAVSGSIPSGFRPTPPAPPPSSYAQIPPAVGPFHRFPTPQFPPAAQAPVARTPPVGQPLIQPSMSHGFAPPASSWPQPPVPMGSPPQSVNLAPPTVNVRQSQLPLDSSFPASRPTLQPSSPPLGSSYTAARAPLQPALPGYPSKQYNAAPQAPPMQSSFSNQGGYVVAPPAPSPHFLAHQGGYIPPQQAVAPPGLHSREQMQHVGSGPPIGGAVQGLIEDFSSLSVGSVPGSMDAGLDSKALPRPLDGDVEPSSFTETYPLNCTSRYLRLTTTAIPNSQSLLSRWHLPLGAVVCPLAEVPKGEEVPIVNFASTGIIRCRRCRTYVNPYISFTDGGRKWRCNICALLNDVPGDYFAHLDASGRRMDFDKRPELTKGSVEFVAPTEYMVRPPMPPLYFFLIDVSISAVRSGMLEIAAQTIKSCLDDLPGFPRTQIGVITFDSTIHFYNMKSSLTQPQMMVVSDLDDIFVPLPDDLLVNLSESRNVVETFLDSLPSMFQDNMNMESAFGPALKAAFMVMSQLGGKLMIFQSTLPSLGVGRLRLRGDDLRVYGTDKEHALRIPEDPFYKQMAADLTKFQIGVNVYAFSDKYTDIASLGTLAKYTGGQVYYYPAFQSAIHKEKLRHELARDLTRETAWEAVMRIRCGKGVRFTTYHGNFMLRSTDLLALPAVDCDKAFAMQLCLEETLLTTPTVYFQVALLYTSSSGERRIRVHTAAAPVVADLGEMYRQADTGAIVSLLSRLAIEKTLSHKLEDARNSVQQRIVKALKEYRNLYSVQHRLGGRMIYPESLKFLPLYGLALCKSTPLRGGYADAQVDERCAAGYTMMALPVKRLLRLLYPSLIRIDEYLSKASSQPDESKNILKRLPLTMESLDSRGIYVYDDGFRFIIWFGRMLPPDTAMNVLGVDFAVDLSRVSLCERDNEMSRKLMGVLNKLRERDPSYYQLSHLVRQGEQPREGLLLLANLVDDQSGGTNGYVDWVLQIHRQIQQNA
ncbi:protein transport protein SEC24 A [Malania oleifera]|uniref:protein transport protein SEC24 A n=1 Tax=Malania oleifera TaxID=397392 RepID=UPI0025ADE931|nr:protein transport protein SEC24 A [Malania oleifera]XP_057954402.1 protein transport protein SEC24 A [Malania oleifera]XP_057954403.1 protein transport protein SEC24 A [Malania oleifera]XP_057954404.1 protein transport protein SEC24 A [Malania oleifera]XP_057954405.1 protein transport protein SEC24 A [Malania oleifera]XP_057954406.1 protein transport protein SEC24 A [Malania oleifera]